MPVTASRKTSSSFNTRPFEPHLRITVSANQGGRRYMEDRVQIECVRLPDGAIDYVYLAVYDGHGGSQASEYVREHLLKNIQLQYGFSGSDEEMLEAIKKGFMETHQAMWEVVGDWPLTPSGYTSTAGTTASCAFIRRGKVFTGHVGDSAIILGEMDGNEVKATSLTVDHKPDNFFEEQRINSAGGMVMKKSGITRVVWTRPVRGHVGPVRRSTPTESIAFLAVARALGDLWSYNRETKQYIVSPEPDVAVFDLTNKELCLVLGSDGLTNVLKPPQIVDIVMHYEKMPRDKNGPLPNHSRWLLRHALEGWRTMRADNITVVTVFFDKENANYQDASILAKDINLNLDKAFTDFENSTVIIGPKDCQQFETSDVELFYLGIIDPNFTTEISYNGPGFTRDVKRALTFAPLPDLPIVAFSSKNRVQTLHRLSGLLAIGAKELSANCVREVFLEDVDELDLNGAVVYPSDKKLGEETVVDDDNDNNFNNEKNGVGAGVSGSVHTTNLEVNADVVRLKCKAVSTPTISCRKRSFKYDLDDISDKSEEHSEAPSSSKKDSRSSLLKSEDQETKQRVMSNDRKKLRTSETMNDDGGVLNGSDFSGSGSLSHNNGSKRTANSFHSIGGASALSPALMLATLRSTNQLFKDDPFARDLFLAGRRPCIRRFSSSSPEPPQKKLRTSNREWSNIDHNYGNHTGKVGQLEQSYAEVVKADKATALPTARSRFWDFISNFLGSRSNK